MIVFENPGSLQEELITTFGASVKSDGAIGYFGTGLKYAIAVCLRHKQEITIYSNGKVYAFGLQETNMRGKDFNIVTMNGKTLGMTTEYGKDWKMWMAFRELYSNALDEKGSAYEVAHLPMTLEPSKTYIAVKGEAMAEEFHNRGEHFITDIETLLYKNESVEIYAGAGQHLYYRGVRVTDTKTRYKYNITKKLDLTEDRTLKSSYDASWAIGKCLVECTNRDIIRTIIAAGGCKYEQDVSYSSGTPSKEFLEELLAMYRIDCSSVYEGLIRFLKDYHPNEVYIEAPLSNLQQRMYAKALAFCKFVGFEVTYPVRIVETLGEDCLALARMDINQIILSKRCFDQGTRLVAQALIEETIHLRERLHDETRGMQTYLFQKIVSLGEELQGEPL